MSEGVELKLATDQFNQAANEAIKHSERTYDRFVNYRAWFLAMNALKETEHADPDKIARAMGAVGTKLVKDRKTKRLKKGRRIFDDSNIEDSFAARIINSRLRKRGEKPLHGKELIAAVKKFRAAAPRSANFIRSGWIWAMQKIKPSVKESVSASTDRVTFRKGAEKGFAVAATPTVSGMVTATVGSSSLLAESSPRTGGRKGNPMPVAMRGLTKAYQAETREIIAHLAKKLGPIFKGFSAP